jgi:hypothetical protein
MKIKIELGFMLLETPLQGVLIFFAHAHCAFWAH